MADKYPTIGELRSRIAFLTDAEVENAQFRKTTTWTEQFSLWAKVRASSGLTYNRGDTVEPTTTHKITIRYNDSVTRDMHIRTVDDTRFKINKIIKMEQGNKRFIVIHAEQIDEVT